MRKRKKKPSEGKEREMFFLSAVIVIPAKAGIQAELAFWRGGSLDSRFRGNDKSAGLTIARTTIIAAAAAFCENNRFPAALSAVGLLL
jgi:hypothetical protein